MTATTFTLLACTVGAAFASPIDLAGLDRSRRATCQPAMPTNLGYSYDCTDGFEAHFGSNDKTFDLSTAWATEHEWQSARPGTVQDANVKTGYEGKPLTAFVVKDMGMGWNPNVKSDADCKCGHERISTARVVSKNQYGEGFYELRARTQVGTPFHAAFWLQGTKSEIDVVEFVDKNMADGGNAKYFVNLHCFDKDDTTSTNTKSQETALKAVPTDGEMHTYGVDWKGAKVTFYFDGKSVATADADCLVGEKMTVVIGHETNEAFGGLNDASTWTNGDSFKASVMLVSHFKYWQKRVATTSSFSVAGCTDNDGEAGKAFGGSTINNVPNLGIIGTSTACATACKGAATCVYWLLHSSKGCILKSSKKQAVADNSVFLGHGTCGGAVTTAAPAVAFPATCVKKKAGAACQGRNYKTVKGVHDDACADACAKDTSCYYWLSSKKKGCIMKATARKCKTDSRFTSHGTCTHDHIDVPGCEKLGAYYGFRGTRVGSKASLTGADQYFDGKLFMTDTACMQACSKLVDTKGNKICKYWFRHGSKGCMMYSATKGKEMFKKKGIFQHGNCNGGTSLTNGWVCPATPATNDGCITG